MTRRAIFAVLLLAAAACGGRGGRASTAPIAAGAGECHDRPGRHFWRQAEYYVRHGRWSDAQKKLDRVLLEFQPGDPRIAQAHFFLGEAHYATGSHLEAAREFRKTSDDTPNDPLAADALLRVGDVYADLWRRPELDPSYGQTALATYQELVNRYPGTSAATRAQGRIADLQERFAYKEYSAALYYFKLKAYDSAILYLKDVVATYPRAAIAPEALVKLVQAYQKLGYKEDVQETCGYIRRFHPDAAKSHGVCPPDSTGAS